MGIHTGYIDDLLSIILADKNLILKAAIPVVKVGWLNPATLVGFETAPSSDFFGPVTTMLIVHLINRCSVAFSLYVRVLQHSPPRLVLLHICVKLLKLALES